MSSAAMSTPTERAAIEHHHRFREHIARKAAEVEAKKKETPAPPAKPDVMEWVERQKQHWFSVVEEIDPKLPTPLVLIQRTCSRYYDIPLSDILSQNRRMPIVRARQVAMFLCKELTKHSYPEIGRRFGGKDHTTVLHACRKIGHDAKTDCDLAADIGEIRALIKQFE